MDTDKYEYGKQGNPLFVAACVNARAGEKVHFLVAAFRKSAAFCMVEAHARKRRSHETPLQEIATPLPFAAPYFLTDPGVYGPFVLQDNSICVY